LCDDDDVATGDALRLGHPVWHVPGELARDSGSMLSGTSLLFEGHTVVYLILNVGITEGKFIILL
jgi:hypothetical protein